MSSVKLKHALKRGYITSSLICELAEVIVGKDLKSESKKGDLPEIRYSCWKLSSEYTQETLSSIGESFGNRSHSTVLTGIEKFNHLFNSNVFYGRELYFSLKKTLEDLKNKKSIFRDVVIESSKLSEIKLIQLSKYIETIK